MKRILVVGASGLLGSNVVAALADSAEVLTASRSDPEFPVDISDPASIGAMFARTGTLDAIICTAGTAPFVPWAEADDERWEQGLRNKMMGQVNLVRMGAPQLADGGCIVLTTGVLAHHPMPGSSILTTVNCAVDGFVASAALEIGRGVRVNAVSPGWVSETLEAMAMDPAPGLPAREVAQVYVDVLGSEVTGSVVPARRSD